MIVQETREKRHDRKLADGRWKILIFQGQAIYVEIV